MWYFGTSQTPTPLFDNHSFPVQTIFDAGEQGVVAMALTPDARYLATVSAGTPQVVCIWDWTVEGDFAMCSATLDPSYGIQDFLLFNPDNTTQIVSNSETQVIFYAWVSLTMKRGQLQQEHDKPRALAPCDHPISYIPFVIHYFLFLWCRIR